MWEIYEPKPDGSSIITPVLSDWDTGGSAYLFTKMSSWKLPADMASPSHFFFTYFTLMNTTEINTTNINKTQNYRTRELIGKITDKVSAKAYSHKKDCQPDKCLPECHYGFFYYKLKIACENKPEVSQIMVFKDLLTSEKIWKDIENTKYHGKTYAFDCSQWMKIYRLVNWREL